MQNKRIIVSLSVIGLIILGLVIYNGFFVYQYEIIERGPNQKEVKLKSEINLEYANVYLMDNKEAYIVPINSSLYNKISGDNIKDRLKLLYNNGNLYNINVKQEKLKGYKVKLDDKIDNIYLAQVNKNSYIIFLKENNKIGLFDYENYYNLLYTDVIDNYNNLENVLKVENNKIYFQNGSFDELEKLL